MKLSPVLLLGALLALSTPLHARDRDEFGKGSVAMEYTMGIGGCLGEQCVRQTPSFSMDLAFPIYLRSFVALVPAFAFTLLGTDYSPREKGYTSTSGDLIMPSLRVEVRHKATRRLLVSMIGGVGMGFYSKTGDRDGYYTDTLKSDMGSFVQMGFAVKYHLYVVELEAALGGRLHTWGDQEGPIASYYVHLGLAVKFLGL